MHLYELDRYACASLLHNVKSGGSTLTGQVFQQDLQRIDWKAIASPVRLLAAGVPCQPFSLAGRHHADQDGRNLFPVVIDATRNVRPQAILLENVRGLLRESFRSYFEYILRQLEFPSLKPKGDEAWIDHDKRIRHHQCSSTYEPEYNVTWRLLEAADYGAPQNRQRVFVIATQCTLSPYPFPSQTHSKSALVRSQLRGQYWERHPKIRPAHLSVRPTAHSIDDDLHPWTTVRDSLSSLPAPNGSEADSWMNHWEIPGARAYKGHTGSVLDWPSKTIKAGTHGVPGGENSVIDDTGRIRYYTLRELARLQSFPDSYYFEGARLHVTRQIGNAVPCLLAQAVSQPLKSVLGVRHADTRASNGS